jgi:NAD(P)-dependent dehydrogenase (short-subunit alcohol dehydrogenase family)
MSSKKIWFITGAGRGMGVDFAKAALAAGHAVVASGRDRDAVSKAVGQSDDLLAVKLDVTKRADAEAAVRAAVDRFVSVGSGAGSGLGTGDAGGAERRWRASDRGGVADRRATSRSVASPGRSTRRLSRHRPLDPRDHLPSRAAGAKGEHHLLATLQGTDASQRVRLDRKRFILADLRRR